MLDCDVWRTEPDGVLASEGAGFRLIVRQVGGAARYLVLQPAKLGGQHPPAVLASGTEESVRAAMSAAGRMAERLSALGREAACTR